MYIIYYDWDYPDAENGYEIESNLYLDFISAKEQIPSILENEEGLIGCKFEESGTNNTGNLYNVEYRDKNNEYIFNIYIRKMYEV